MKLYKYILCMLMVCSMSFAQDAGVEFGIEDDLTVFGTDGDINDADLEVKGYTKFGTNDTAKVATNGSGNVFVSETLEAKNIVVDTLTVGENAVVSNLNVLGMLNVSSSNELQVTGDGSIGGNLQVDGGLAVSNSAVLDDDLLVKGNLTVWGNSTLSNSIHSQVGIGTNIDADVQMQVRGSDVSGKYTVKFYTGTNTAAWIRKK